MFSCVYNVKIKEICAINGGVWVKVIRRMDNPGEFAGIYYPVGG